jgi:hypothetical protein
MQIEINDRDAELVVRLLRIGYRDIAKQSYAFIGGRRTAVDTTVANQAMRAVAHISAQIALGLGKDQ